MPKAALPSMLVVPARTAIEMDMPAAPNIISERRPNFSMVKIAIQLAMNWKL
jgi:hypothetical protein